MWTYSIRAQVFQTYSIIRIKSDTTIISQTCINLQYSFGTDSPISWFRSGLRSEQHKSFFLIYKKNHATQNHVFYFILRGHIFSRMNKCRFLCMRTSSQYLLSPYGKSRVLLNISFWLAQRKKLFFTKTFWYYKKYVNVKFGPCQC